MDAICSREDEISSMEAAWDDEPCASELLASAMDFAASRTLSEAEVVCSEMLLRALTVLPINMYRTGVEMTRSAAPARMINKTPLFTSAMTSSFGAERTRLHLLPVSDISRGQTAKVPVIPVTRDELSRIFAWPSW